MNLLLNLIYSMGLFLLFKFPMKELAELNGVSLDIIIFMSAIMSYITTQTIQCLSGNDRDITFKEFFYTFSRNVCILSLMAILGYPMIGFLLSIDLFSMSNFFSEIRQFLFAVGLYLKNIPLYSFMDGGGSSSNNPNPSIPQSSQGTPSQGVTQGQVSGIPRDILEVRSFGGREIVFLSYAGKNGFWVFKGGFSGDHDTIFDRNNNRWILIRNGEPQFPKVPNFNRTPEALLNYNARLGLWTGLSQVDSSTLNSISSGSNQSSTNQGVGND
uniref:hypothetical protein n=1 Tax=Diaporthe sojae TaxID=165439 RepID=UPI0024104A06|nr:hypothetical protein QAZ32_mgp15 [Diaporthe sojae]WET30424.1 hypothetical protein [Diaporthe sojae]